MRRMRGRGRKLERGVWEVMGVREVTGVGVTTAGVGVAAEAMIAEGAGAEVGAMTGRVGVGAMIAGIVEGVGVRGT